MSRSRILDHLNPQQQEAVCHGEGPLLVLAGPGSGKTRTLTYRAAWLIKEKKVRPENILLLTFTNRAAEEMRKRIWALIETKPPWAGTFHSFCARILRIEGQAINLPANFLIYDQKDQLETIKLALAAINLSPDYFQPRSVLRTISQAKNELITALEYPQYARGDWQTSVARIYLTYQRLLKEYQALDFDDLLLETSHLFQKEKSILTKYQNRFEHLLVDEYQDTNQAQYVLTRQLAGKWRNLCVVGDAAQAIYGFRGANFRHLVNLQNDFPELKIIKLQQNYRSTPTILKAAHEVIKKNKGHPTFHLWTEKKQDGPLFLYEAKDELREALFVIKTIQDLIIQNQTTWGDFAVLYRTNAQSRVLEEAFLKAGIPYGLVGGTRFYERKEIKDCLAYLRLVANPKDKVSLKRIEKIGKRRKEKFFQWLKKNEKRKKLIILNLLEEILSATNYLDLYRKKNEKDLARLENIKELYSVAGQFSDLNNFLEKVALMQEKPQIGKQKSKTSYSKGSLETVTLMTAHAAKGTEFPVVFMVGLEEGLFPHNRSLENKDETEEERRLFYVGVTRAKEKLFLTYTRRRLLFGRRQNRPISQFIQDISPEIIKPLNDNLLR